MASQSSRGDLRIVRPRHGQRAGCRLGLLLCCDTSGFAEIVLTHTYLELATSADVIVPAIRSGLPYDLAVQTDLRGVIWTSSQTSRRVGQIPDQVLEESSDLLASGRPDTPTGLRTGTPLGGVGDRRWAFKVAEGKALDRLTAWCTRSLLDTTR